MRQILLITVLVIVALQSSEAQLFKKLQKRVQDKIERKVEDKVVEELSEEIANQAMKPINSAFDDMFRKSYKDTYGKDYDDSEYEGDPEKQSAMMAAMLNSMYGNVELPEEYKFEYKVTINLRDFDSKKDHEMYMLITPSGDAFGMIQEEGKKDQTMVFDMGKDQVVIFNDKDKSAMVVPNVMKMSGAFAKSALEDPDLKPTKFEKTNKTKKILGYKSVKYEIETEEDESEVYISDELPFDWADMFGSLVKQISPNFYKENPEYSVSGMMMEATTKRKKDGKKSKWEVKKIEKTTTRIKCSDYKLANAMGD